MESDSLDPRIRIKALELLGKISDVGLFAERTEVTITNKSTIELENTLRDKLKKLMGVDNAEDAVITSSAVVPVRTVTLGALDAGV
jgi:acetyl-CoA carboxylase beta subunit